MSYESQGNKSAQDLLSAQLRQHKDAQLKSDCKALLSGGMPSRRISQTNNGHTGAPTPSSTYRPQNATGLLATDYALNDYNTWK